MFYRLNLAIVASLLLVGVSHADLIVEDNFETVSFSNNNGTANWSGDWIEVDVAGVGPALGNVLISGGVLSLNDYPDTGRQPSLAREVDLLSLGATNAILSFNFATTSGVDVTDAVVIEASANGGGAYTVLETFTGIDGASSGTRIFAIDSFISNTTRVRFRVTDRYGFTDESFLVDNVRVAVVPEPSAFFCLSLVGVGVIGWKKLKTTCNGMS